MAAMRYEHKMWPKEWRRSLSNDITPHKCVSSLALEHRGRMEDTLRDGVHLGIDIEGTALSRNVFQ